MIVSILSPSPYIESNWSCNVLKSLRNFFRKSGIFTPKVHISEFLNLLNSFLIYLKKALVKYALSIVINVVNILL
jgi:hypothetical protein